MSTFEQTRQRLERALKANRAISNALAIELGDAMQLHAFMRNKESEAKVKELEQEYNMALAKVDTIDTAYRKFLKDGKAPEGL
jgi:beta-N-acetylglucosaminidase